MVVVVCGFVVNGRLGIVLRGRIIRGLGVILGLGIVLGLGIILGLGVGLGLVIVLGFIIVVGLIAIGRFVVGWYLVIDFCGLHRNWRCNICPNRISCIEGRRRDKSRASTREDYERRENFHHLKKGK